jgi:hypothetical protein
VLDPVERISEVLFGLIMALTFTGAVSAAEGRREEIRTLLVGALACNVAGGIVDGAMYLMACLAERGRAWRAARAFRDAGTPEQARAVIAEVLPPTLAAALGPSELEAIRRTLVPALVVAPRPRLTAQDWKGAFAVLVLVILSTFPIVIPFLLTDDAERGLRLSNAVAIAMLLVGGMAFGRVAGYRPWVSGLAMVALGLALVAITIALGG